MYEVWIVSEYADRGSLAGALRSGLLEGTEGRDMVSCGVGGWVEWGDPAGLREAAPDNAASQAAHPPAWPLMKCEI